MRAAPAPRRVVVTGIGVVSPAGTGLDAFWKGLHTPPPDRRERTAYVVTIPGTKDWQLDPRRREHLTDFATNAGALGGLPTARVDGIAKALERAGARPHDQVMLVGHSQGGMLAVRAADEWTRSERFAVTHVVTAGAPIGGMTVPASVQVLALESRDDVVPRLDARANDDRANVVTVRFDTPAATLIAQHALETSYLPAATALASSPYSQNPSLLAWSESATAFIGEQAASGRVRVEIFDIRNADAPGRRSA